MLLLFLLKCCFVILAFIFSPTTAADRYYFIGIVEVEWDYTTGREKIVPFWQTSRSNDNPDYSLEPNVETTTSQFVEHPSTSTVMAIEPKEDGSWMKNDTSDLTTDSNDSNSSSNIIAIKASPRGRRFHRNRRSDENLFKEHSFIKAVYRLFTDDQFWQRFEHPRELGLIGPVIVASPGDRLFIHCKNFARFNFNIRPHLVHHDPSENEPGVEANGGEYLYRWHVDDKDIPPDYEEPCILGAYHSALNSPAAEIEAGLFGPLLICKRGVIDEPWNTFRLRTGELLAYAIVKFFYERQSVYQSANIVELRNRTDYPTINGLTRASSLNRSIALLEQMDCDVKAMPGVYLHSFTFGHSNDVFLLTTSCGLMMENGRTMSDTLPLYSGSFKSVFFQMSELARFSKNTCYLESSELILKAEGLSVQLFSPASANLRACPVNSFDGPQSSEILIYNLSLEAVLWNYYQNVDVCSRYWKLRFFNTLNDVRQPASGLLGPTLWASILQQFQVILTVPRLVLDELVINSSSSSSSTFSATENSFYSLGIKMPEIVEELQRVEESDSNSFIFRYTFFVKPSRIGTKYDSPCRPFLYSATFTKNGINSSPLSSPSFDTGLFGALIVCQSEIFMESLQLSDWRVLAPIVIDESLSWLAPLNVDCLASFSSPIFHTINGLTFRMADFGMLQEGADIYWYFPSVPPLPGRHTAFQYTLTFSDEGRRNPIFYEQMGHLIERKLILGSTVVLQGSGQVVVMRVGAGKSSPRTNYNSSVIERWSVYCQITGHLNNGMQASFSVPSSSSMMMMPTLGSEEEDDKVKDHFFIMAQEIDWNYKGNLSASAQHRRYEEESMLSSRRHIFRKLLYRNVFKKSRVQSDDHLSLLGPVVVLTPEHAIRVTLLNMARKPVGINPGAGVIATPLKGAEVLSDGSVDTGKAATFLWQLSENFEFPLRPNERFPECSATLYTSSHDKVGDLYAGLVGPLLICPKRVQPKSEENATSKEASPTVRRFFTLFARFDESRSSLATDNQLTLQEMESSVQPLVFDTVNGRLFGAVDQPGFAVYANQPVDWFLFSIGDADDIHAVHFHGSSMNYVENEARMTPRLATDSVTIFPGQSITGLAVAARMQPSWPGVWPIHCHAFDHANRGMMAQYIVSDQAEPLGQHSGGYKEPRCNNNLLIFVITTFYLSSFLVTT